MIIIGIGGILGDAAAAILKDGELAAAVEESKIVRRRPSWRATAGLPEHAISTCLELAGARPEHVNTVAVARPVPESDFYLKLRARFSNSRILMVEHHTAHAASAYFASPFDEATVRYRITFSDHPDGPFTQLAEFPANTHYETEVTSPWWAWGEKRSDRHFFQVKSTGDSQLANDIVYFFKLR